jgi:tRNA threonylcarbamoyladenosine biosynthesis protein TsaB
VLEVPLVGVCTLDVVAAGVGAPGQAFRVATDARRKEVYWAAYDETGRRLGRAAVSRPAAVEPGGPVAGRGPVLYPDDLGPAIAPEYPAAADLALMVAEGRVELLDAVPLYLRRPDVSQPAARKRVL